MSRCSGVGTSPDYLERIATGRTRVVAMIVVLGASGCGADTSVSVGVAGQIEAQEDEGGEGGDGGEGGETTVHLTPTAAAAAQIAVARPVLRPLPHELDTTGSLGFDESRVAHVSPLAPGRIVRVIGKLGDTVEAGAPMAVLRSMELAKARAAYLRGKARYDLADTTYQRQRALASQKIASEQSMHAAKAEYLTAKAALRADWQTLRVYGLSRSRIAKLSYASSNVATHRLRAPLGGTIVEKRVAVGERAVPSRTLFTIADLSTLWMWIDIYERDLRHVQLGDVAELRPEAYPSLRFTGEVTYIRDEVDPDTRTVRARISVDNADGSLRAGMFVRVRVMHTGGRGAERSLSRIVVPSSAVLRLGDSRSVVFVVTGPHRYEARTVEVGMSAGDRLEIRSGITTADQIVVHGGIVLKSELLKDSIGGDDD